MIFLHLKRMSINDMIVGEVYKNGDCNGKRSLHGVRGTEIV